MSISDGAAVIVGVPPVPRATVTVTPSPAVTVSAGGAGPAGPPGPAGPGVAPGGTVTQALIKTSSADYATTWADVLLSPQANTITVSPTAPSSPAVNDIWIDTT